MKKAIALIVLISLLLCSCTGKIKPDPVVIIGPDDDYEKAPTPDLPQYVPSPDPDPQPEIKPEAVLEPIADLSAYNFDGADGRVVSAASKSSFTRDIELDWNGHKITIEAPKYTGLRIDQVYSYKKDCQFNSNGYASVDTSCGYFTIDKDGNVYDYDGYKKIESDPNIYAGYFNKSEYYQGRQIADNRVLIQTGEDDSYKQRLHTFEGEPLSDYYDYISYFFDGLALVAKDRKIGFIDQSGKEVLKPTIEYDHVEYPLPPPKNNKTYFPGDIVNNAFVISIGGELAVINIKKQPSISCDEFLRGLGKTDGYVIKDINGDNSAELIVKKQPELTVYGYNGSEFFEIGKHRFGEGSLRLLECESYPGIAVFVVGGGANRFRYLTIRDGILRLDDVFNYYYSQDVPQKYRYISDDKQLIAECENAYNSNSDLVFLKTAE